MHHQKNNIITTEDTPLDEKVLGGAGFVCFNYMKKQGTKIAQIDPVTGATDTFESLLKRCVRTGVLLQKKGVSKGDIITYYSNIHLNACVPIIASFFIGAVPTFLDTSLPASDIEQLLKQVNPKLLLTDSAHLNTIKIGIENAGIDTDLVIFDDAFFKYQEGELEYKPVYINDLSEVAAIYFSSGSTGLAKGILLNHYRLVCGDSMKQKDLWKENENKVLFAQDSFYWTVATKRTIACIRHGVCQVIGPELLAADETWYMMEKYKVNVAYLTPYNIGRMCSSGKPKDVNLSSLTTIVSEGAPLPAKYQLKLQELLPNTDVFQVYGQTEVGLLTTFKKTCTHKEYIKRKIGSVGLPLIGSGISYKVVDLETGKNLGPNQTGELRVKSKTVMAGYYNADSSDRFDEDGWLKTGDMVYYDEDYCFFVVDRLREMFLYRGWHASTASLESELVAHPAVKRAAVIAVPHDQDGEHALGVVVLDNNTSDIKVEDIERYMNAKDADRSMIRIKIVKEIPLTPTGKIKKQELRKRMLLGLI